jgi:predicted component of type VI protein secretion system
MDVSLAIVAPPAQQRTLSAPLPVVVGRGEAATLRIKQESVSRRHCEIFTADDKVYLRDLGSTNGTRIDKQRLAPSVAIEVAPGTVARIGDIAFRIDFTPVEQPAAMPESPALPDMPALAEVAAMPDPPAEPPDLPAGDPAFPDLTTAELPTDDHGFVPEELPAADAFDLPAATEAVDPGASFEFLGDAGEPPAQGDASLDDFLKGLP